MKIVALLFLGFAWGMCFALAATAGLYHVLAAKRIMDTEMAQGVLQLTFAGLFLVSFITTAFGFHRGWFQ